MTENRLTHKNSDSPDAAGHAQSLADNVTAPVAILPADKQ